jgi:GTPase SAR1 family protein
MRDTYIAGGESFLLTYAINSLHSYEETASFYKQILRIKDCDSFPIVLVANKCDLEKQRQVPEEQARCVVCFISMFILFSHRLDNKPSSGKCNFLKPRLI